MNMGKQEAVLSSNKNLGNLLRKYGLLIVMLIMIIVMSIISNVFFTADNILNVLRQVSINGIIALSMTLVIISDGIDLSVGALVAVAGTIAGSIITIDESLVWLAILAALAVTTIFGLINGAFIAGFNMPPFVVTLATMTIARGFGLVYADGRPYILSSESFRQIGQGHLGIIPIPVIILVVLIIFSYVLLHHTTFGREIYAIGGNANTAVMSGVKVKRKRIAVYSINGLFAGISGIILAARISSGQPAIGEGYELDAITAVVIGGTSLSGGVGTIAGTVVGFIVIGILNNALTLLNVSSYYQDICKGVIILAAVLFDMLNKRGRK